MSDFKNVDIRSYAESLSKSNGYVKVAATKHGCVAARHVLDPNGEDLTTYVQDGTVETINHANCGDWILTAVDPDTGKPVLDAAGRTNTWAVPDETFKKKYDTSRFDKNGNFSPKGGTQTFARLPEDVSFSAPWGEQQNVKAGGYINITDPEDIYGIARDEFYQTYDVRDVINGKDSSDLAADLAQYKDSFRYVEPDVLAGLASTLERPAFREVPFDMSDDNDCGIDEPEV